VRDFFLDRQRNRLQAAETIETAKKIADSGDLEKARTMVKTTMATIDQSISAKDELCKQFNVDLKEALDGMVDRQEYQEKGMKKMAWKAQAHEKERAVGKGGYDTSAKMKMKSEMLLRKKQAFEDQSTNNNKNVTTLQKKISIGNEHSDIPEDQAQPSISLPGTKLQHKWKMYVRGSEIEQLVEKVEFGLHPSFQPSKVTVSSAPFEVERTGWGFFVVRVTIFYKSHLNKAPSEFEHELCFEKDDTNMEFEI